MTQQEVRFPIVGIGASAGGVEALELFFRASPANSGMAFVIVTHLSPERESVLHEIVTRFTAMIVEPATDGAEVRPNHVYVLLENATLSIEGGRLKVIKPTGGARERKLVDVFLSALAKDAGEFAAGVILSGGDGDGTLGVKAIKERGGVTLAQTADHTAPAHPDMPEHAIASGMIDFALPVQEMPARLQKYVDGLHLLDGMAEAQRDAEDHLDKAAREEIYALLRNQVGHDFSGYKVRTFVRRVQRRMQVVQLDTLEGYTERLRQDPVEVMSLFRDLLINVTNFFRDADAFESLKTKVIPQLFEGRGAEDTVRVWVPGCATGEEVYSIAILMREVMDGIRNLPRVQIFATDIDDRSLTAARAARYPDALLDSVSEERRRRFFTNDGGSYVVTKDVRDLCIFSPHSLIRDPPFSRMDLVSCRNLLIYLGLDVQAQVIPLFHYALRPGAFLFLGMSENVSQFSDLFSPIEKKHRIFRARDDVHTAARVPTVISSFRPGPVAAIGRGGRTVPMIPLRQTVESQVMERFAPPHVVVNIEGDVVFYSARTGKYLEAAAGAPSRQLMALARKGLRLELRSALREVQETRRPIVRDNLAMELEDGRVQLITLSVDLVADRLTEEPLFLVLFDDDGPSLSREEAVSRVHGEGADSVDHLERELRDTRERLQSTVEEYETALEELKSSNEELVSVNEELQSTNEELEASKEELQSLNEELQTVNLELSHKVDALDLSNSDLRNLFDSSQVATIFLDRDLNIRNFTPPAAELFSLRPADRGRPLADFSSRLAYPALFDDLRTTLATGDETEAQVEGLEEPRHYLVRSRPYAGLGGQVAGVILAAIDVTVLQQAEERQRELVAELNHRVKNILAVIIALTRQTAKNSKTVDGLVQSLTSRLDSMARAYELLSREEWTEAQITDVVAQELAPFAADRVSFEGPAVTLRPKQALSLSMVLHELATNASKYGALSKGEGWVEASWTREARPGGEPHVRLVWRETGGPVVVAGPTGFGTKLVERETAYSLAGNVRFDWDEAGLVVQLDFPVLP